MLRGRFGESRNKDFRDGHIVMDAFQQAAFRDHIREGERVLYLASMGLLKHKRVRNTIEAEPTPRSSQDSEPAAPSDSAVAARQGIQEEVDGRDHCGKKGRTVEGGQNPMSADVGHGKRTTSHRKAKRSLSRTEWVDRRTTSSDDTLDKVSTSEQRSERVARSSNNKEHGDRNNGWFRGKAPGVPDPRFAAAEREPCSGGSEALLRHTRNRKTRGEKPLYCLGDPRFMPISDVDKAFPGQRVSAVQARDPETAAAVRAARAERALGSRQGDLVKALHKRSKIPATLESCRHAGPSGDKAEQITAALNIEKSRSGERKYPTGTRPRSAPPVGKRGLAMNDCGHPRRAEVLGRTSGGGYDSGRVRSQPSRESTTESASSARTSDTQTSEITVTSGGSSFGGSNLTSRRRPHTAGCHRSSLHNRSSREKWSNMACGGLTSTVTSAESSQSGSARRYREDEVHPVIVTHSASAIIDEL